MANSVMLQIQGMHCASCVARVEGALRGVPGVRDAVVNLATEKALVRFDNAPPPIDKLKAAVASAGYSVAAAEGPALTGASRFFADPWVRLMASTLLTLPVFLFSMPHIHFPYRDLLFLVLATPVQFWCGWPFLQGAVRQLRHFAADMNSLIALGTLSAFLYSAVVTLTKPLDDPGGEVYFEAQMVIVTLILLGRYLEDRAKGRASQAIRRLMELQPRTARIFYGGQEVEIPIDNVSPGDEVVIRPGEQVPVDGVVSEGSSPVNESMLTGEPMPVMKKSGDTVYAGSLNTTGAFRFRASKVGAATMLGQIIALVEQAQTSKAPVQRLADRVAAVFVPVVLLIAALAAGGWLVWGSLHELPATEVLPAALTAFVSTLIIACPCALGLATPTAIMVGTGRGAELGILIRGGEALEKAGRLQVVLLDKTGTITKGEPEVTDIRPFDPPGGNPANLLRLAASAERSSEHPLALALVNRAKADKAPLAAVTDFEAIPGLGVRAKADGREVLVGNDRFFAQQKIELSASAEDAAKHMMGAGKTPVFVAVDGRPWGIIAVADTVRETSATSIVLLRVFGMDCWMLTGDNQRTAEAVGKQVGITRIFAQVLPDQKASVVREAQKNGLRVAMVGDGINDAPALAQADLGIAMRSGTDVAMEAGDVVLMRNDLLDVVAALLLARKTMTIIKQNLFFAFVYNIIAIPLAAFNVLNPMIASATMALSSVSVVTNSLRLRRFQPVKVVEGQQKTLAKRS